MRKNSQIHLLLESELLDVLRKQAEEMNITISELCRQKLRETSQLNRIENLLERIVNKIIEKAIPNDRGL